MQEGMMELLWKNAHLYGGNLSYVEQLYETYLRDPHAVSDEWRKEFDKLPDVTYKDVVDVELAPIVQQFREHAKSARLQPAVASSVSSEHEAKQVLVLRLINGYRVRGHQAADIDPLNLLEREVIPDLDPAFHTLNDADLDTVFSLGTLQFGPEQATLRQILIDLKQTYCASIGSEYMHIVDTVEKRWIQHRLEPGRSKPKLATEDKVHILERLTAAEGLEKYLGSRFAGAKRFGLEGAEALIISLDETIQRGGENGAKEIIIGMAHRGRLNTLVNIFGKNPADLFGEFEGKKLVLNKSGDVKYHQGFSSNVNTPGGEVHLAMAFNPSHLEIAAPVVEGSVRARQDRRNDKDGTTVIPVSIHGDAAFAGQGVVTETFQMSQTRAYKTGGTIHIVINNQVGFTTSRKEDARSTEYCTDVAKMIQAPIFHVNADDPEAVRFVTQVAIDYRTEFKRDVVIDLVCYRRRGHNEADEPFGTQPTMYKAIKKQKTTRTLYSEALINDGVISAIESKAMEKEYRTALENGEHVAKALVMKPNSELFVDWKPYLGLEWSFDCDTAVDLKVIQELNKKLSEVPEGFVVQRQVKKIYENREKMAAGEMECNWGFAETMAYATTLAEGFPIRFTGQDVGRGTFSHRHAVLHDQEKGGDYTPLQNIGPDQPTFELYDSFLSEEAVLAFEYGYATTMPNVQVIWEAQFGDFANGAQVVIDQFITSGEQKWERLCGLTLLLPHGFEGQGPEHSSARLERFLQMCAEHNIQVCTPTTPAQIFHLLRRQIVRPLRKPLIVMSPKSLLGHRQATSPIEQLSTGTFEPVLAEVENLEPEKVKRVVLCGGKVYYDLYNYRQDSEIEGVAIVRIEQLYPFPDEALFEAIKDYTNLESIVWCQEEPMNQGAWYRTQHRIRHVLERSHPSLKLHGVGRPHAAAPAVGYMSVHLEQQKNLVEEAING